MSHTRTSSKANLEDRRSAPATEAVEDYAKAIYALEQQERVALEVIRHHRLIEAFLADALEMPWDRVHDEAEVLEHYISEELERRIADKLGNPALDPHGDPIPTPELAVASDRTTALARLGTGQSPILTRV